MRIIVVSAVCLSLLLVGVAPAADSLNCRSVGSWPFGPYCYAAAIDPARSLAFCGSSGGVFVLDVSDPSQPAIVSASIATHGTINGLAYQANRLHIATSTSFEVWDVTTASDPALLGWLSTRNCAVSVAVAGSNAYVAVVDVDSGKHTGLSVIDISDPGHPHEDGYLDMPSASGWDVDVAVVGSYAFFADGNPGGLHVIDVSNPLNPYEVGCCDSLGEAEAVVVVAHNAFVADFDYGLRVVDISDPHNPRQVGQCAARGASDVAVVGNRAYVVDDGEDRLDVIDVSNPLSPHEVGHSGYLGSPACVVAAGGIAYVAVEYHGLALVDVSNPTSPHKVGFHRNPGATSGVAVSNGRAYLTDSDGGELDSSGALRVFDVSDPHTPAQVGQCDLSGLAFDVAVVGNLAYVTAYDGLHVVDVADPQNPLEVAHCGPAIAFNVEVAGDYAYIGYGFPDNWTGMCVVSISDPHNPQVVGSCSAPGIWFATVAVSGSYAFLANWEGGLRIIDVSNPQNPHEVAYSPLAATVVALRGNYAYVLADSQLYVLDVSDPLNLQQVGSCLSAASDVAVDGDYAYLSDGASGGCALRVILVSDPQSLQEVGYYWMRGDASGVAVGGGYVYVARHDDGLQIFEFYGAGVQETANDERATMNVPPSIVRGVLLLPASGVERGASSVLLDAAGRKVAELRTGANDVRALAPGVYFVREAQAQAQAQAVRKVVLTE